MAKYNDWEPAAQVSKSRRAISEAFNQLIPNDGRVLKVAIVKPLHGDPYMVYNYSPGIKVVGVKVSARECDNVKSWKPF